MSELPESFAEHPRSLAEVRSDRSQNAAHWTPRDALISVLREIDSGEFVPDTLVVCYSRTNGDSSDTTYVSSSPNALMAIGTVGRCLYRLNKATDATED